MPEATTEQTTEAKVDGITEILSNKKAPEVTGRPIYEKDMDWLALGGFKSLPQVFGQKIEERSNAPALPLNFGSKSHCGHLPEDTRLRLFHLKKMINNLEIQTQVKNPGAALTPAMMKDTSMYKDHLKPLLKAFNITDFSNWIPTVNARFYFEEYEIPFILADQFDQMPMDSATVEVPGDTGVLEGHEETDVATFGEQSTTQANYAVTSRNNVVHTKITEDLMQDNAPPIIDKLRRDVVKGIVRAYEKAIINGDTTILTTVRGDGHMDTDTRALGLNETFSKAFDGLRRKCINNDNTLGASGNADVAYKHGGDTASKVLFEKVLNLMGKFASEKDTLRWIIPSVIENQVVTGAIPELFTAFAYGGLASNVTGQMPPVFGVKPVTSQYVRDDLNESGVYDGSTTDRTIIMLVKVVRFYQFVRQAMRVWAAPSLPSSDYMLMTAKMRHSWNGNNQTAEELGITMGYDILRA